jgi:hypothetical protein
MDPTNTRISEDELTEEVVVQLLKLKETFDASFAAITQPVVTSRDSQINELMRQEDRSKAVVATCPIFFSSCERILTASSEVGEQMKSNKSTLIEGGKDVTETVRFLFEGFLTDIARDHKVKLELLRESLAAIEGDKTMPDTVSAWKKLDAMEKCILSVDRSRRGVTFTR